MGRAKKKRDSRDAVLALDDFELCMRAAEFMGYELNERKMAENIELVPPDYAIDANAALDLLRRASEDGGAYLVELPTVTDSKYTIRRFQTYPDGTWISDKVRNVSFPKAATQAVLISLLIPEQQLEKERIGDGKPTRNRIRAET